MKREEALIFLKKNLQNKNLFNHSLAVEAAMIGLAKHFDEDIGK